MRRMLGVTVCALALAGGGAMAQNGPEYLDISKVQVRADKIKDFEDAIKKMAEVNRKYKGDRWVTLTTEYGEFGGYTFTTARENMAAVESGMGAFNAALREGLGAMGEKLMRDFMSYASSGHSEIRHRRWDLSVNKGADAAETMKLLAQTRWVRMLTIKLKPGRSREYTNSMKPFVAELEKISPAVPVWVSESVTGPPAVYVSLYFKSMAEMDAWVPGIQKAVASEAYQQMENTTQNVVVASTWEILRIRPELSCPPDPLLQADPAFWKPKPAMAPKPKTAAPEKK